MTRLNLLLRLEEPEVDLATSKNDVVRDLVEVQRRQDVLRPVAGLVDDGLNAHVRPNVPNFDNLVSAQGNQVVAVLVDCQVLDGSVMSIQVRERAQGEGVPHDNVSFLSTTRDETVLARVNERVDTLLMKVETFVLLVLEFFHLMNVDHAVQGS